MNYQKYNAKPTVVDGVRFASQMEARRFGELKLLLQADEIASLELQPRFELQPAFVDATGEKHRAINYVADFDYFDRRTGEHCIEEVKGHETAEWLLKKKMFLYKYPHLTLRIIK